METFTQSIQARLKHKRKLLFEPHDPYLEDLQRELEELTRRQLVLWALKSSEDLLDSPTLHEAHRLVTQWARGEIKMPQARQAILSIHQLAGEAPQLADELRLRAIAQGLSCVHTPKHALGLPLYQLSSLVHRSGIIDEQEILAKLNQYHQTIEDVKRLDPCDFSWANFL